MELPLFPLATVLFPGLRLPLHVFEERYRLMMARVLSDDRRFGVVCISRGMEAGGVAEFQAVGCVAEVEDLRRYPDGRLDVATRGTRRFRIDSVVAPAPYVVAQVTLLDETAGNGAAARATVTRQLYERYLRMLEATAEEPPTLPVPADPLAASYAIAANLRVDLSDKQRLLAYPTAVDRLRAEGAILHRELALLDRLRTAGPTPTAGPFSLN